MPTNRIRKKFHDLVSSKEFDLVIMFFIALNMFQMCLGYEGIDSTLEHLLVLSNHVFSLVFLLEAIFKLIAYGWSYFRNNQNRFDFFVVISSFFDIVLEVVRDLGSDGFDDL